MTSAKSLLPLLRAKVYPPKFMCWNPNPQNMTVFGDGVFKWVNTLRWGRQRGPKNNTTRVLIREYLDTDAQREDNEKTKEEGGTGIYKPKREASEEIDPILNFLPPELWENTLLLFKPSRLWYFVTAAQTDSCSHVRQHIHRFQGLTCGHLWGTSFCLM